MKCTRIAATTLLTIAGIGLLSAWTHPVSQQGFRERDVRGRYVFQSVGEFISGPLVGPATAVGYMEFDGHGALTFATQSFNASGQVFNQNQTATGTYTVEPDGRGTIVILPDNPPNQPFLFDVVLVNKKKIVGSGTNPELVVSILLEKQK